MEAVSKEYINNPSHVLNHILNTLIHPGLIIRDMLLGLWLEIRKPARSIELFKLTKSIFSRVVSPPPLLSLLYFQLRSTFPNAWICLGHLKENTKPKNIVGVFMGVVNTCNVRWVVWRLEVSRRV